jgi:tetratricopeptide (TPR) repeat protein
MGSANEKPMMDRNCDAHTSAICCFQDRDIEARSLPDSTALGKSRRHSRRHSALAPSPSSFYSPPNMAPSRETQDGAPGRKAPPPGNAIPARGRYRPKRNPSIPPQPTIKSHTIRLLIGTAIGAAVMLVLLMLAVKYAQRDWNQKNQRAWAVSQARRDARVTTDSPAPEKTSIPGEIFRPLPGATRRHLRRLSSDPLLANHWLLFARGLSDRTRPDFVIASLRMAMAVGGEDAGMKNDLGVVYLQQRRLREANQQFRAAEQIRPGFPPARYNLALCAISERNPILATRLLGQYLGQRPDDITALRLQSTLLTQLGRPEDALRMLERFLKSQSPEHPLFLEAATLAARLGQSGNALRYLDTAMNGNSIQSVVRTYQSPTFRDIRLSGEGDALATRIAGKARAAFGSPVTPADVQPLRATTPDAKVR